MKNCPICKQAMYSYKFLPTREKHFLCRRPSCEILQAHFDMGPDFIVIEAEPDSALPDRYRVHYQRYEIVEAVNESISPFSTIEFDDISLKLFVYDRHRFWYGYSRPANVLVVRKIA